VEKAIKANTKLVVMTHVSNATGTINPIAEVGAVCRDAGVTFLVDASQSAGELPIDVNSANIDLLAAPGHKGLLGPAGTGVLYIRVGTELDPVRFGGTGIFSEEPLQPDALPYRYESGTQNTPGIAGLGAALKFIDEISVDSMRIRREELTSKLLDGLSVINGVTICGSSSATNRGSVVSITIDGVDVVDASLILDTTFGIAVRSGLHCAPDAHRTIGTFDTGGTIRFSPGYFNTEEDIFACLKAIEEIARA
jgi:selenocysteine lyase/cysteine desulfurase